MADRQRIARAVAEELLAAVGHAGRRPGLHRVAIWRDDRLGSICKKCLDAFAKCCADPGKEHRITWRGK